MRRFNPYHPRHAAMPQDYAPKRRYVHELAARKDERHACRGNVKVAVVGDFHIQFNNFSYD